jgi:hypothetical protein
MAELSFDDFAEPTQYLPFTLIFRYQNSAGALRIAGRRVSDISLKSDASAGV